MGQQLAGGWIETVSTYSLELLTVGIVLTYIWSLGVLLPGERTQVRIWLFVLVVSGLALRLVALREFPPGMIEDEPKDLAAALDTLKDKRVYAARGSGLPLLPQTLFEGQLVPVLGPNRESMRIYSAVTGAFAAPVAYALARALAFSVSASLVYACLVVTLPWSLYYGRVSVGGELIFHQLLLLAALARLVFASGGWREALVAAFGQILLFYDYFAGRLFVPFSMLAAVIAPRRRRFFIVVALLVAIAAWVPYILSSPNHLWAPSNEQPNLDPSGLLAGGLVVLKSFVWPLALDTWFSVRSAAVHPLVVVLAACIGGVTVLARPRLASFLWGGFLLGIAPAVGTYASTRRMIMGYPFLGLMAVYALDRLP
ncbi:MAG: hypothetical protein N3C12_08960 [Candidatus Binatia bacterium]|nr:hypothetical protein [Candidatus Binatia bacterium]